MQNLLDTLDVVRQLFESLSSKDSLAILEYHDKEAILINWTPSKTRILRGLRRKLSFGNRNNEREKQMRKLMTANTICYQLYFSRRS